MDTEIMFSHDNGQRSVAKYLERHLDRIVPIFNENRLQDIQPARFIGANTLNQDFEALASPLISVQTSQAPQKLSFATCRHCSGHFEYRLREGATVCVLAGLPDGSPYTAISYVWGETSPRQIGCDNCDAITTVPLADIEKLHKLLQFTGAGRKVWLDCLSIDQGDHADIAQQLAVMGDIYKNAESVKVFLPDSDASAFQQLQKISQTAWMLLQHLSGFLTNQEQEVCLEGGAKCPLAALCKTFFLFLSQLEVQIDTSIYFQRAWTFQEWALARELDVTCDSSPESAIRGMKSIIIDTASIICRYIVMYNDLAEIETQIPRGEILPRLETVKRLFPHEDHWLSPEEVDDEERRFQALSPSLGVDQYLGIRSRAGPPRRDNFRARLGMMLNALDIQRRKARFDADLVSCWASMCNITYDYRKDDPLPVALDKVVRSLRQRGITIWNFHVNCLGASLTTDMKFFFYAREQPQINASNLATLPGAPVFTGCADTVQHIIHSLTPKYRRLPQDENTQRVLVVEAPSITVECRITCENLPNFLEAFSKATYGKLANDDIFQPVLDSVAMAWRWHAQNVPETLLNSTLLIIRIPATEAGIDSNTNTSFCAWVLFQSRGPECSFFVGREHLNGSLMVFARRGEDIFPMGYLTITDQLCGTFLVRTDEDGLFELVLRTPLRGDMIRTEYVSDRIIRCRIPLGESGFYCCDS